MNPWERLSRPLWKSTVDWKALGGSYELDPLTQARASEALEGKLAAASDEERARAAIHHPDPEKRFHYRYIAADLAWEAANLLPDQTERTAEVLWKAGSWLKDRDPKAADRFYKALVKRCETTALGREASRVKWFPKDHP